MLGFIQLEQQIKALDYHSWSMVIKVLQRLEVYILEAKKKHDWAGLDAARSVWEDWNSSVKAEIPIEEKKSSEWEKWNWARTVNRAATNGTPPEQPDQLKAINLVRTRTALRQMSAML